ncbi:MAG: histidine kinase dimerization/phospho-acceptor domain-containing protein [Planctomycetota bacterium]
MTAATGSTAEDTIHGAWLLMATVFACIVLFCAVQYVRRQRLSAEELRRTNAGLRKVLDQAAIVSITDAAGRITHVNDAFVATSGYSRTELVGGDHRLINSGHHPRSFWSGMYRTVHAGGVWRGEIKSRGKDGTCYWVLATMQGLFTRAGELGEIVSIRTDISALKAAEDRLRHQAAEAELLAEVAALLHDLQAPLAVRVHAILRRLVKVVPGIRRCALFRAGRGESVALGEFARQGSAPPPAGCGCCVAPDRIAKADRARIEAVRSCGPSCWATEPRQRGDAAVVRGVLTVGGEVQGLLLVAMEPGSVPPSALLERLCRMLADWLLAERLRVDAAAADAAKDRFLATMSHELRTPLTAILGFADELAAHCAVAAEPAGALSAIRRNGRHILGLIEDILDLAGAVAGRLHLQPVGCDPRALLAAAASSFVPQATSKGLELAWTDELPAGVGLHADPRRVRQILVSLIGNAVKFTTVGRGYDRKLWMSA